MKLIWSKSVLSLNSQDYLEFSMERRRPMLFILSHTHTLSPPQPTEANTHRPNISAYATFFSSTNVEFSC